VNVETLAGTRAPVRMWVDPTTVEPAAAQQLRNAANLPWTHGVAVMPDVHYGIGATVGSVIAMRQAVSPAAVGVDIGCGVSGVRLRGYRAEHLPDDLGSLRSAIEAAVPVGFRSHGTEVDPTKLRDPATGKADVSAKSWTAFWHMFGCLTGVADREDRAHIQMGTLGGGNHFIELCTDDAGGMWVTLHSGSRNIGKELAERHIATAKTLPHNQDLPDPNLAVFLASTPEMAAYRRDLYWAQDYAARNRDVMLALVKGAVRRSLGPIRFEDPISCHHNYVSEETYDGIQLLVTRKGAISTADNRLGIIPGSMGTGSYVVRGLGNPAAYCSASHGAGRRMSRGAAKRAFTVEDLAEQTAGVECRKDAGVIDEIPGAYKRIEDVMAQQADLVEVLYRLRTVLCVKG
jgi:tRNA-splicing ligase RtcB (3'-phosphate/5'-hydroxy nucleic acid ligase)